MAQSPTERVWEGRLHLGDEPGVYGDAAYCGLSVELPLTLHRLLRDAAPDERVEVILEAQDVRVFEGYAGHLVRVLGHFSNPEGQPEWTVRELATGRLARNAMSLTIAGEIPAHVSVSVHVDTDVGPGLFDDFVLRRLSLRSASHYASLGFRATT
jgi:hypothetical protein